MAITPLDAPFKEYSFSYTHDGAEWALRIRAASPEDAKARIGRLTWARYDGEIIARIPASLGLLARLAVFARNFLQFSERSS